MAGPAKPVAAGFPGSPDAPIWEFLRKVGAYDPLPYWATLAQPVFIGLGEEDEKDNVPVQESVRRIERIFRLVNKHNYDVVVVPGAGHALWTKERTFAPLLVERLEAWLGEFVLTPRAPASGRASAR
jgi:pimeloyl-ACP methyl ester carboxylesterase